MNCPSAQPLIPPQFISQYLHSARGKDTKICPTLYGQKSLAEVEDLQTHAVLKFKTDPEERPAYSEAGFISLQP